MKYIKTFESWKLLLEYEIFQYKKTEDKENLIQYKFETDGLKYLVQLSSDPNIHKPGTYEVSFGIEGQESPAHETKKDLKHLNSVIYTVDKIVKEVIKKRLIRWIEFSGARGDNDSHLPYIDTVRGRLYLRFMKRKYPKAKIQQSRFGNIQVDAKTVYPKFFKGKETKADLVLDLIIDISDENPDDWRFENSLQYDKQTDRVQIDTDAIVSSKHGSIYIVIDSSKAWKQHTLEWTFFNTDEEGYENFNSFKELYAFAKKKFL